MGGVRTTAIERISATDAMQLVPLGPVPGHVGAVLLLGAGADPVEVADAVAARLGTVPRLRQRLVDVPFGCGRPIWVDDPSFDAAAHVERVHLGGSGDEDALLVAAVAAVTRPLSRSRPLWRAVIVSGLADGRTAVVVVMHHVLADGIGGLAILAELADGPAADPAAAAPAAAHALPRRRDLVLDALAGHAAGLRSLPRLLAGLWAGRAELGGARSRPAPRCSLNAPTGPRRRVVAVECALDPLKDAARSLGGTVNDAFLAVVGGAAGALLAQRGESVPALVVSVSVAGRATTTAGDLGNRVGVMPVRVPTAGPVAGRLAAIAALTRTLKLRTRGASAAIVVPLFRALGRLGLGRWFVDRQRLVSVFLTSLRGPVERLTVAGRPVARIFPVTGTAGNVAVAFAAMSYAGRVTLTATLDPDRVPDADRLVAALADEIRALLGAAGT